MVAGFGGSRPPGFDDLVRVVATWPSILAVARLQALGVPHVIVHGERDPRDVWVRAATARLGTRTDAGLVAEAGPDRLYRIGPVAAAHGGDWLARLPWPEMRALGPGSGSWLVATHGARRIGPVSVARQAMPRSVGWSCVHPGGCTGPGRRGLAEGRGAGGVLIRHTAPTEVGLLPVAVIESPLGIAVMATPGLPAPSAEDRAPGHGGCGSRVRRSQAPAGPPLGGTAWRAGGSFETGESERLDAAGNPATGAPDVVGYGVVWARAVPP